MARRKKCSTTRAISTLAEGAEDESKQIFSQETIDALLGSAGESDPISISISIGEKKSLESSLGSAEGLVAWINEHPGREELFDKQGFADYFAEYIAYPVKLYLKELYQEFENRFIHPYEFLQV